MRDEPKVIIENGIVVNAEVLKRYWQERYERNRRIRHGMFRDLEPKVVNELSVEKQPSNKEVLDSLHKTQVLINDLQNRLNTHVDASRKKRGKY